MLVRDNESIIKKRRTHQSCNGSGGSLDLKSCAAKAQLIVTYLNNDRYARVFHDPHSRRPVLKLFAKHIHRDVLLDPRFDGHTKEAPSIRQCAIAMKCIVEFLIQNHRDLESHLEWHMPHNKLLESDSRGWGVVVKSRRALESIKAMSKHCSGTGS